MENTQSRVAMVVGASAGIGLAIATKLVSENIYVVGNARRKEKLEDIERKLNAGTSSPLFVGVPGDVTHQETLDALFYFCEERFASGPDIFVINAGHGLPGSILDSDEGKWEELFHVNCISALRQMRVAGHSMVAQVKADPDKSRPRDIVVIGSVVGRHVSPSNPVYGATKFAVNSLAEALRQELGKYLIRVTLVEPGIVQTEFQEVAKYDLEAFNEYKKEIGPFLLPEDIANFVSFVVNQPAHVHFNNVVVRPTRQSYP